MTQNLSQHQSSPSLTADPATSYATDSLYRRVTWKGNVAILDAPIPPQEMEALKSRLAECRRAMLPMSAIDRERIALALSRLFSGYAHTGSLNPQKTIAAYIAKLSELPTLAIEAAISDIERGRVEGLSPDFPPSASRIFQLAEAKTGDLRSEKGRIETLLQARVFDEKPRDPDEMRRVAESMRTLADDMAAKNQPEREMEDQRRRERDQRTKEANDASIIMEYRMHGLEPVMVNGRPMTLSLARATGAELRRAAKTTREVAS